MLPSLSHVPFVNENHPFIHVPVLNTICMTVRCYVSYYGTYQPVIIGLGLFVVSVLIRLMEHRAAASVPLIPHPPLPLWLRGPGHEATGRTACGKHLRGSQFSSLVWSLEFPREGRAPASSRFIGDWKLMTGTGKPGTHQFESRTFLGGSHWGLKCFLKPIVCAAVCMRHWARTVPTNHVRQVGRRQRANVRHEGPQTIHWP